MPLMTPQIQDTLDRETDARFWAQTGFAPGRKLDPKSKIDAAFVPVWLAVFKKVKAEWAAGKLVTTYDHPAVVSLIKDAKDAFVDVVDSVHAALNADNAPDKAARAADAAAAHKRANDATTQAATYQPPTVSPQLAQHAANQVAVHVMTPQALPPDPQTGVPEEAPPLAPISVPDAMDALQASHAPGKAAATQTQTPSPEAPQAPQGNINTAFVIIGICCAGLAAAAILNNKPEPLIRRKSA
jgi:hypothetical protein